MSERAELQRLFAVSAIVAVGAGSLASMGIGEAYKNGRKPVYTTECGDAPVALEGGNFIQAAQDAGAEAGASSDTDYHRIGGDLRYVHGHAYSGQSVWLAISENGNVETYGMGTCEQPWSQGD